MRLSAIEVNLIQKIQGKKGEVMVEEKVSGSFEVVFFLGANRLERRSPDTVT